MNGYLNDVHPQFKPLLDAFLNWASARREVRAAIIIGSQAQGERVADVFSDLDLVIVTPEPRYFVEEDAWLNAIGLPIVSFRELRATGGELQRRVLFEPGLDVDFIPFSLEEWTALTAGQASAGVLHAFAQGYRVILNREGGSAARLSALLQAFCPPAVPDNSAFQELCADYLYHGLWAAKKLCRGELFTAKLCLDGHMKRLLVTLIEWHARLSSQADGPPIGSRGRFLEQWAPAWIQDRLGAAYGAYAQADLPRALRASMSFFRDVGVEAARRGGHEYPVEAHARIERLIDQLLLGA